MQMYNNAQVMNDLLTQNNNGLAAATPNFGQMTLSPEQLMLMKNALYGNNKLDLQV